MLACAKNEAKKLVKPHGFLKKIIFKENLVAPANHVLHLHKFGSPLNETISFEIYYIKFFKIWTFEVLNGPIIGRIKILTCQIPCILADLLVAFDSFSQKMV